MAIKWLLASFVQHQAITWTIEDKGLSDPMALKLDKTS